VEGRRGREYEVNSTGKGKVGEDRSEKGGVKEV
jgi:hypothetical protein